jgi:hypothetical protein
VNEAPLTGPVLVTGGTGFIGGALTERLLGHGIDVDVLTRDRGRARARFGGRVRVLGNLDEIGRDRARPPPRAIVNLAGKNLGEARWNRRVRRALVESRIGVTRHVVGYLRAARPRPDVLVSGSAVGYYGARGDEALDEHSPPGDEFQSRLCVAWEAEARRAEQVGIRVCVSRTGAVLGPGGGLLSGLVPVFSKGLGAVVGSGRQWVSWIQLDDLVDLLIEALADERLEGVFNNTAPEPVRHDEFARALGQALRRPVLLRVPTPVYRAVAGGIARLHVTGQRVLPARHVARGHVYRHANLSSALAASLGGSAAGVSPAASA